MMQTPVSGEIAQVHDTGDVATMQATHPTSEPAPRPGVFRFVGGAVTLPSDFTPLVMTVSNPSTTPFLDHSFQESCKQLRQLIAAREVTGIQELAQVVQTLALQSDDPAVERKTIEALSIKQQFLSYHSFMALPVDEALREHPLWQPGFISFLPLATKYYSRGRLAYESGLAAAELLRNDRVSHRQVLLRIGEDTSRLFDIPADTKGLLLSGEVTAVRIVCEVFASSLDINYKLRPLCWLVWRVDDIQLWSKPAREFPGGEHQKEFERDNLRLAYLLREKPRWCSINTQRVLQNTIRWDSLNCLLTELCDGREN